MGEAITQVLGYPLVHYLLGGLIGAMAADYDAFRQWRSWHDAQAYDWGVASWRWCQGLIVGLVSWGASLGVIRLIGSLLIACVLATTVACGGRAQQRIDSVPPAVEQADQHVHATAIKALGILESAGRVANAASQIEQRLYTQGAIPQSVHQSLTDGFRTVAMDAMRAITAIESGATETWPALKAQIDPLLSRVQSLVDQIERLGESAGELKGWLGALKEAVLDTLGALMVQGAAFGGAR